MSVCPAIPEEATASDCDEVFVIVHTNDVHGYIEVEPYVKAVADEMRAEYGNSNVITVSAGDVFSGGNAVAHLYNGETIPPIMDAAGYDALVPGNKDFNFGRDQFLTLAGMFAHTRLLCANLFHPVPDENGDAIVDEDGKAIPGDAVFDRTMTVIDPMVNGEPLDPEKTYRVASGFNIDDTGETEPLLSTMEDAAAAMGEYLGSGGAVILPDVPLPDHRIVPMNEMPAGAVTYSVTVDTEKVP